MTSQLTIRSVFALALLSGSGVSLPAQDGTPPLRVIHWDDLKQQGQLSTGEVIPVDGPHANVLEIAHSGPGPADFQLVEITEPGITELQYAVSGQVRYENVTGTSYLEMLNYLPDGRWFFTRGLAEVGPMQYLTGSSTWRDFRLPGSLGEDPNVPRPNRLVINLHLDGPGTVYLSDLRVANDSAEWYRGRAGAWWGDSMGGLVGGLVGTLLGLMGATIGMLMGVGRGRRLVTALLVVIVAIGSLSLLAGIAALALRQPYAVYYPLLLTGVIATVLGACGFPLVKQRFHTAELRRMQALDAR
jgi:hypothetical protein